jgi:hypothetical protein
MKPIRNVFMSERSDDNLLLRAANRQRRQSEDLLREMAFVLQMTRRVKGEILEKAAGRVQR